MYSCFLSPGETNSPKPEMRKVILLLKFIILNKLNIF